MKPKILFILVLVALLALGLTGAAWAAAANGQNWMICSNMQQDTGNDWVCDENFENIQQLATNTAQTIISYQDNNNDGKNDTAIVTVKNGFSSYYNSLSLTVKNIGNVPISMGEVVIENLNPEKLEIRMLESPQGTIKPGKRKSIGIEFRVSGEPEGADGSYSFMVYLKQSMPG